MNKFLIVILSIFSLTTMANPSALNETLVRIINQINAITPLLDEAKSELNHQDRIQLHIENFIDSKGQHHAGVREDLLMIRNGLIDYINKPIIAPAKVKPLKNDFVSKP